MLVVDDCPFNIIALKNIIHGFDIGCDFCMTGAEALQKVRERVLSNKPNYKLILMDYSMPECDGISATRSIKQFVRLALPAAP